MAITTPSFTTTPLSDASKIAIEIVPSRPNTAELISPPDKPGRLVGYYNPSLQAVELFITSGSGQVWLPIAS